MPGLNRQQTALIKVAVKRLGMADADYRALLQRVAGVQSSKDLTPEQFEALLKEFARLGFVPTGQMPQYGERAWMATPGQINKIRSLWRSYAGTEDEDGLCRWMEKHFGVSHLRFLDFDTAAKVIAAGKNMKKWRRAHPRRRAAPSAAESPPAHDPTP